MKVPVSTALFLILAASALRADEIHLYRGKPKLGVTVKEETFKEVVYTMPGVRSNQPIPADQVKEVIYKRRSDTFELAEIAMATGDYRKGASMFEAAAANPPKRGPWEKQYGLFNAAECQRAQGEYDKAIAAYDRLLKLVPDTKFYGDVFERKAQCYLAQRQRSKVRETYEALRNEVKTKGLSPRWDIFAEFQLVLLNEGSDAGRAQQSYEDIQRRAAKDFPDVANMARLRIGYVYIKQGKTEDARIFFQEIIDDRQASAVTVVAGAYTGLGSTYVNQNNPTAKDFETALFPFLRVIYHYDRTPSLPEALYWAGRCLEMRAQDREANSKRAKGLYRRLMKEYPTSEWARLATERA